MGTGNVETPIGNGNLIIKKVSASEAPNNGVVLEFGNSTSWVGQLYIGDNKDQGIYYNGWSNGIRGSWKKLAFAPVSLFDNSSGTSGSITLSETSANFTYLEFFICDNKGNNHKSVRAYNPNGKNISLDIAEGYTENNLIRTTFRTKRVSISGTSVTIHNNSYSYLSLDENGGVYHTHEDFIKITKIVGYR